jgi:hypothetical protein
LQATATLARSADNSHIHVRLVNGNAVALQSKLTLVDAKSGSRILPAYFSDDYISLLPGETQEVEIEYPLQVSDHCEPQLNIRGWNLVPQTVAVAQVKQDPQR